MIKIKIKTLESPPKEGKFIIPNRTLERILVISKFGGIKKYTVEIIAENLKGEQSELFSCSDFIAKAISIDSPVKIYNALTKKI